ncbi:MAG: choice-of-anchor tandem repeat GloVer-containing protein [Bryobacteraceae bacterium]
MRKAALSVGVSLVLVGAVARLASAAVACPTTAGTVCVVGTGSLSKVSGPDPLLLNGATFTAVMDFKAATTPPPGGTSVTYSGVSFTLNVSTQASIALPCDAPGATVQLTAGPLGDALEIVSCSIFSTSSFTGRLSFPAGTIPAPIPVPFPQASISGGQVTYVCGITALCGTDTTPTTLNVTTGSITGTCIGCPALTLDPTALTFFGDSGGASSSQSITPTAGSSVLSYAAAVTPGANWLSVNPAGAVTGSPFHVIANPSLLPSGLYTGTVTVYAAASNAPKPLPVTFNVAAALAINPFSGFPFDSVNNVQPDGSYPNSLIQSADGNFYGTAASGGDDGAGCQHACEGTVFRMAPGGQLTRLFTFAFDAASNGYPNGANPAASLVEGSDGNLYGTTSGGGISGLGTVFKISKSGVFQKLHDFCGCGSPADGRSPSSPLIQGKDGAFYGTTSTTIFRVSSEGALTGLADIAGAGGLTQATDGNFYAIVAGDPNGYGSVLRMTAEGTVTTLHSFGEAAGDGQLPKGRLIQASSGLLYGVTSEGGLNGSGSVFEVGLDGSYQTTYDFSAGGTEGSRPQAGLIQASEGKLWGTAQTGGALDGRGTVFTLTPEGLLAQSAGWACLTGFSPVSELLQAAGGKLYGVSACQQSPSDYTFGTVYKVQTGLAAPMPSIAGFTPTKGATGTTVMIRGNHLIGTKAVTFNGVSAAYKVNSINYIAVKVPAGATTGHIAVTNAGGTATSPRNFGVE